MPKVTIINPTVLTESDRKLRVAAYCRVSSSSEDQLNSYQAQLTYYSNKFNDSETEELVELYADSGITGTCDKKRTEFMRMINDCRRGKIDRIYAKSISRFARNTRDCLKYIRELKSLGITIMFEKENIDTAKMTDEIMITIMGGLAQEESVSISHNMQWSIERRMKNGTFNAPSLPYGYTRENNEIVINQAEADIVRYIYESYLSGVGMESIAICLNQGTDKSQKGFIWCKNTIRYVLTNEKYTGSAIFQKYYTSDEFPFRQRENKGERDKYLAEDVMPVIITRETFETVQNMYRSKQEETGHNKGGTYIYSSKIKCGICGCTYRRKIINGIVCWTCTKHNLNAAYCENMPISENTINYICITMFNKLYCNYRDILLPLQSSLYEIKVKSNRKNGSIIELNRDIINCREQLHVLASLRTKGFLSEEKYQNQCTEINRKISKLQKDIRMLSLTDEDDEILQQIDILIDIFQKREHLMVDFEDNCIESIIEKITVKGHNTFEIHLIGGLKLIEKI